MIRDFLFWFPSLFWITVLGAESHPKPVVFFQIQREGRDYYIITMNHYIIINKVQALALH